MNPRITVPGIIFYLQTYTYVHNKYNEHIFSVLHIFGTLINDTRRLGTRTSGMKNDYLY